MDKSFNDQELSDIMKEIEALEENLAEAGDKVASPVMEELAHMEENVSIPNSTANIVSLDSQRSAPKQGATSSMSFKVQGDLTLDLQFDIAGKVLTIEVNEEG